MSKHTPGPWTWLRQDYAVFVTRDVTKADDILQSYETVCDIAYSDRRDGVPEANAALIAAAPEMLEMLKTIEAYYNPEERSGFYEDMCELIRKAEGK